MRGFSSLAALAALFLSGVCSQYFQMSLLRELVVRFSGLELTYVVSVSAAMIWTGAGCAAAGLFRPSAGKKFPMTLAILCAALPVAGVLSWGAAQLAPDPFFNRGPQSAHINSLLFFCGLSPLPFGLINGLIYGLSAALLRKESAAGCYSVNAAGDAFGGVTFSVFLAGMAPPLMTLCSFGFVFPALALVFALAPPSGGVVRRAALVCAAAACAAALGAFLFKDSGLSALKWARLAPGFKHFRTIETPHGRFDLLTRDERSSEADSSCKDLPGLKGPSGRTEIYLDGVFLASAPVERELFYPGAMFAALQPERRNLKVMAACSPFSGLPAALRDIPAVGAVDFVCPDAGLVRTAREMMILPEESYDFRVVAEDPRVFLERPPDMASDSGLYDIIIFQDYSPDTLAGNRFFTRDFFSLAAARLKSGGAFIAGMASESGFMGPAAAKFNASLMKTLGAVFPKVAVTSGGWKHIAAGGLNVTDDFAELDRRQSSLIPDFKKFPPGMLSVCFSQSEQETERKSIQSAANVPVNTDFFPALPFYYLVFHSGMASGDAGNPGLLISVMSALAKHWAAALCVMAALWFVSRALISRAVDANLKYGAFENGFFAAGIELLLLFVWQNHCGSLYRDIAAAVGVFIGGAALGAMPLCAGFAVRRASAVAAALIPAALPAAALLPQPAVAAAVFLFLALAGVSVGVVYAELNRRATLKIGSSLWTWEMFGGALGAVFIVLFLLPSGGFIPCAALLCLTRLPALFRAPRAARS